MARFNSRSALVEEFRSQLSSNERWAVKGLIVLFNRQTEDEQAAESTRHSNHRGFNHSDAKKLTGIAKWYNKNGFLTASQIALVQRKIPKYAKQLVDHGISTGRIQKEGRAYIF